MARVTKINVGGTNYDIAHEGELKNSGFEVVTKLPTTGLFAGRQVFYKGQEYIYNGAVWCNQLDPLQKLYIPYKINFYTLDQLNSMSQVIQLRNSQISQIPELLAGCQWTSVFSQILRKSEFDCEIKSEGADWVSFDWLFWDRQYRNFSEGTEVRITTHNLANFSNYSLTQAFFLDCYEAENVVELKIEYLNYKNLSGDNDINNEANYEWRTIFKKELKTSRSWVFPAQVFVKRGIETVFVRDIRLTLRVVSGNLYVDGLDFYLQTQKGQTIGTTPFLINYNSAIKPTQTGEVFKTNKWILQYLTQGVNWLKNNNVSLSAYNSKVAALEQADSDNNASIQSVSTDLTELSNGLATVATSGSYNDLTDTPNLATVATSGSYNDLIDIPAFSGSYNDLTDTPNLATVATSGSYNDLTDRPTQLPNPNPIIIKTADGVSVRYDGSTSGGVTLEAGNNAELTATQDSDDTMTVKFGAIVPQTLPNPNALNIIVLDSEGALLGPSIVYDGVATKYIELIEGYGITLSNSNLSTGQAITINLKQIAGTTLLGNANDTIGIPQAVTMTQLRTMLGSLTLNDIDVTLGGNNSYTLPCYIDYNGVDYPARIRDHWLQIYRNGVWANLMYLGDILPTQVGQITSLDNLDWYNEQVSEYEVDSNTTTSILNSTTLPATVLFNCPAEQLTLNLYPISGKQYGKGSLDSLITDLQGKGFSVFVENDLDAIIGSGSDYLVRIKISKVPTPKAIIECYVAR